MRARFEVTCDLDRRLLFCRMSGLFGEDDMRAWAARYRETTDRFEGGKHAVVADMRGMKTMHPSVARLMGEEIAHARRNGVVLCAHISDDTVQRLQAARIARQSSPADDVTIDVDSLEEAYRVVDASAKYLLDPNLQGPIRAALEGS